MVPNIGAISLLLFLLLPSGAEALALPRSRSDCGSVTRLGSRAEAIREDNGARGSKGKAFKRKRRCADFPPSAYRRRPGQRRSFDTDEDVVVDDDDDDDEYIRSLPFVQIEDGPSSESEQPYKFFEPEFANVERARERARLATSRTYARSTAFKPENVSKPPTLRDLAPPETKPVDRYWAGAGFRIIVLVAAYNLFPYVTDFADGFVTMEPDQLDEITGKFGPGLSILYGTFVSLTLNIQYNRQQSIQKQVSTESSLLALVQRNILSIFRDDRESAIEGSQCVADQLRTLVRGSRGQEMMGLIYSDPYARILELIEEREYRLMTENGNDLGAQGAVLGSARDSLKDVVKTRAARLSDEALALPPTHFFILTVLTLLILGGYTISILPTVRPDGRPSQESSLLFAVLCAVYVLFFNFANDLNNVWSGVYQIRRSAAASHLLQIKWLIANHPLTRGEVEFDEVEGSFDGEVMIRTPGLGDMMIVRKGFNTFEDKVEENILKE